MKISRFLTVTGVAALAVSILTVLAGLAIAGCGQASEQETAQGPAVGGYALADTIVVSGVGKATATPDQAVIQVSVESDGTTAAAALDTNSKDTQKVLDRLKAEGIKDNKVQTTGVTVYPNRTYDPSTGQEKTTGYRAQNTVSVTLDDIAQVGKVFAAASEAGADSIYGPTWQLEDNSAAVTSALSKAIANARMKAEAIAADQGLRLGDLMQISEGVTSNWGSTYQAAYSLGEGAGGAVAAPPINPHDIEVTVTVTVTYRMIR